MRGQGITSPHSQRNASRRRPLHQTLPAPSLLTADHSMLPASVSRHSKFSSSMTTQSWQASPQMRGTQRSPRASATRHGSVHLSLSGGGGACRLGSGGGGRGGGGGGRNRSGSGGGDCSCSGCSAGGGGCLRGGGGLCCCGGGGLGGGLCCCRGGGGGHGGCPWHGGHGGHSGSSGGGHCSACRGGAGTTLLSRRGSKHASRHAHMPRQRTQTCGQSGQSGHSSPEGQAGQALGSHTCCGGMAAMGVSRCLTATVLWGVASSGERRPTPSSMNPTLPSPRFALPTFRLPRLRLPAAAVHRQQQRGAWSAGGSTTQVLMHAPAVAEHARASPPMLPLPALECPKFLAPALSFPTLPAASGTHGRRCHGTHSTLTSAFKQA